MTEILQKSLLFALNKKFLKKTVLECIKKADAQWYYLILGAYDMEGYVCWTKNGFS